MPQTHQQLITALREKRNEIIPKKNVCNQCSNCAVEYTAVLDCADNDCKCHVSEPLSLQDLLVMINLNSTDKNNIVSVSGNFMRIEVYGIVCIINLSLPIESQSEETLTALLEIIK